MTPRRMESCFSSRYRLSPQTHADMQKMHLCIPIQPSSRQQIKDRYPMALRPVSTIFVSPEFRRYYYLAGCPFARPGASCEAVFRLSPSKSPVSADLFTLFTFTSILSLPCNQACCISHHQSRCAKTDGSDRSTIDQRDGGVP